MLRSERHLHTSGRQASAMSMPLDVVYIGIMPANAQTPAKVQGLLELGRLAIGLQGATSAFAELFNPGL